MATFFSVCPNMRCKLFKQDSFLSNMRCKWPLFFQFSPKWGVNCLNQIQFFPTWGVNCSKRIWFMPTWGVNCSNRIQFIPTRSIRFLLPAVELHLRWVSKNSVALCVFSVFLWVINYITGFHWEKRYSILTFKTPSGFYDPRKRPVPVQYRSIHFRRHNQLDTIRYVFF
jgi:hypothetical protein